MEPIYLLEAVGFALPASVPRTGSRAPDAEETETRVEFDWLAESLGDLGRLNRSRTYFTMLPPFFFDFFAAVGEVWSAMEMRARDKNGARRKAASRHLSFCANYPRSDHE